MSRSTTLLANLRRSPLPRLVVRHRLDLRRRFLLASVFESEPHAFPVMQSLRSVRLGGTPIFTVLRIKKGGEGVATPTRGEFSTMARMTKQFIVILAIWRSARLAKVRGWTALWLLSFSRRVAGNVVDLRVTCPLSPFCMPRPSAHLCYAAPESLPRCLSLFAGASRIGLRSWKCGRDSGCSREPVAP